MTTDGGAGDATLLARDPDVPVVIQCEHLVRHYDTASGRVQAVRGVDLEVEAGSVLAIAGPSGCGKSSLLRMISGIDPPTAGAVLLAGVDLYAMRPGMRARRRARIVTLVRQRPGDNLLPFLPAADQLARLAGAHPDPDAAVVETLEALSLSARAGALPSEMSGGERQRLAIGRAMVSEHPVVVADEPTSQLDGHSADAVIDALGMVARRGAAVVVASHDRRVLDRVDEVVSMRDGAITSVTVDGAALAVIDRSGRVQLPPEVLERFPDRRARLRADGDDVVLERP